MATKKKDAPKVPVTRKALIARVNRKLAAEGEKLITARGASAQQSLGNYYAINVNQNYVTAQHVDPVKWARELGVLQPYEEVID